MSEELVDAEGLPPSAERFWVVDPLDGTREFVARNGEFAVCIGLVEEGRPVFGVLHGPAVGLNYAAYGLGTATRQRRGEAVEPIRARIPSAEGLVVVHSRSHENSRRVGEFLEGYPVLERRVVALSNSGRSPRGGRLSHASARRWNGIPWQDTILEAAGGRVETLAGAPLSYGKPGLKNDGFIAWGRCVPT